MKVLIVDDGDNKIGPLLKLLESRGIDSDDIDVINNIARARLQVRTKQYALAIVDLFVGQIAGARAEENAGLEFIRWILHERSNANTPWRIVGATSHAGAAANAREEFDRLKIPLIHCGNGPSPDLTTIERTVDELLQLEAVGGLPPTSHMVDFAIVCALDSPEFSALDEAFPDGARERSFPGASTVKRVQFQTSSGAQRSIILASAGAMGSVPSCYLVTKIIEKYLPRLVILTGICGGIPEKAALGDTICASEIENFQSGKIFGGSLLKDRLGVPTSESKFPLLRESGVMQKIVEASNLKWAGVRPDFGAKGVPSFLSTQIGCSDLVVADKEFIKILKADYRQMRGVEMEGYGAGFACKQSGGVVDFLLVKSVCDLAGEEKDDKLQPYCSYMSASAVREILYQEIVI
jgi:nucleoside phosphorylase/CheY-like chemotaxis protein